MDPQRQLVLSVMLLLVTTMLFGTHYLMGSMTTTSCWNIISRLRNNDWIITNVLPLRL